MPPDRTTHLITAAKQRHELTRAKATRAIRELDHTGVAITFGTVAQAAQVSRSWLYTQPDIRDEIRTLRAATPPFEAGGSSVVLARFVPVVRTFTPIVAGAARMTYHTFVMYNMVGGALWGCGVTVLGYFLGQIAFVKANIELILVGIVALSVAPLAIKAVQSRRSRQLTSSR